MLTNLPKVITRDGSNYYLAISCTDNCVHVKYLPSYHEDVVAFSYWWTYGNEGYIEQKAQEFIQKWLDEGNVIVRQ